MEMKEVGLFFSPILNISKSEATYFLQCQTLL